MNRKDSKGRVLRKGEGELKDGRYYFQYYDLSKKRRKIYANSIKELREKEDTIIFYNIKGIDIHAGEKITLNEYFDRYMKTKINLKSSTRINYLYMYNKYIRNNIGRYAIGKIKYSMLKDFLISLIVDRGFKINSVEIIHTILHPVFSMAVRDEIIFTNPSNLLIADIKKSCNWERTKRRALTKIEQKNFIKYVSDSPIYYRWLPLFVVFLGTGLRLGEAFALTDKDIDFDKNIIKVDKSLIYRINGQGFMEKHISFPKTVNSIRVIPMIDDVYNALKTEIKYRNSRKIKGEKIDDIKGFIFLNKYGNVHNQNSVNRAISNIIKDYNKTETKKAELENREVQYLPHFSMHNFRHTFCTRFCEVESNVKVIQDIMGHSDISTTMNIYAEATMEAKENVMKKLNNINFITIE